jgi:hypothetical protein
MLECLGQMWTWVSGEGEALVVVTGPYRSAALDYHVAVAAKADYHAPGASAISSHVSGSTAAGYQA